MFYGYCMAPKRPSSYWALDHESKIWAKDLIFTSTIARPKPTNSHQCRLSIVRALRKRIAYALLTGCSGNHSRYLCTCSVTSPGHITVYVPGKTLGNSAAEDIN